MADVNQLKKQSLKELTEIETLADLEHFRIKYLGRKGELTAVLRSLKEMPESERKKIGKLANDLKKELESQIVNRKSQILKLEARKKAALERIDITAPGIKLPRGHLHPITKVRMELEEIFQNMGFEIIEGPDAETAYYNFDALNIPDEHPARDLWNTFWLRQNEVKSQKSKVKNTNQKSKLLLRTHTSPMQIRYMEKHQPPFRIIVPGRCFRYEAVDASHSHTFYQVEGLMVDNKISVANFKSVIEEFFRRLFTEDVGIRLRPGYFPFVEPGFEVDISCLECGKKGCRICSQTGWIEIMGAGMVHPNVFKAVGYVPRQWQGFAFGMGLDRLAIRKYGIDDIRLFYSGDLRFLKQF